MTRRRSSPWSIPLGHSWLQSLPPPLPLPPLLLPPPPPLLLLLSQRLYQHTHHRRLHLRWIMRLSLVLVRSPILSRWSSARRASATSPCPASPLTPLSVQAPHALLLSHPFVVRALGPALQPCRPMTRVALLRGLKHVHPLALHDHDQMPPLLFSVSSSLLPFFDDDFDI